MTDAEKTVVLVINIDGRRFTPKAIAEVVRRSLMQQGYEGEVKVLSSPEDQAPSITFDLSDDRQLRAYALKVAIESQPALGTAGHLRAAEQIRHYLSWDF